MCIKTRVAAVWFVGLASLPGPVVAQDQIPSRDAVADAHTRDEFSPYAGREYPTQAFWGDSHVHSEVSVDAGTMTRLSQEDTLRFARGEEVVATGGFRAKLGRPLDWIVLTDHAEMYGLMPRLLGGAPEVLASDLGRRWYDMLRSGDGDQAFAAAMEIVGTLV